MISYLDFQKYQQLQNQQRELVHKHDQAIMNGSDMNVVTQKLNAEAIQLSEQEDKLITNFVTETLTTFLELVFSSLLPWEINIRCFRLGLKTS